MKENEIKFELKTQLLKPHLGIIISSQAVEVKINPIAT